MTRWGATLLLALMATACGEARQADRSILVCANEAQMAEIALGIIPQMAREKSLSFHENGEIAKRDLTRLGDKGRVAPTGRAISFYVRKRGGKILLSGSNFGTNRDSLSLGFFYVDSDGESMEFFNSVMVRLQEEGVRVFDRTELQLNPC